MVLRVGWWQEHGFWQAEGQWQNLDEFSQTSYQLTTLRKRGRGGLQRRLRLGV
jgi:hypothetical protein